MTIKMEIWEFHQIKEYYGSVELGFTKWMWEFLFTNKPKVLSCLQLVNDIIKGIYPTNAWMDLMHYSPITNAQKYELFERRRVPLTF